MKEKYLKVSKDLFVMHKSNPRNPRNPRNAGNAKNEKFKKLEQKILDFKSKKQTKEQTKKSDIRENHNAKKALNVGIEFISAVVVSSIIGIGIDEVADTAPFALIVMFLIGIAAGILNILRFAKQISQDDGK